MITDVVFHYLNEHSKFLFSKLMIALVPAGIFVITDMHREVLAVVLWLLIIDTILGITVAVKYKKVRSNRMNKALCKFILYMVALSTAYLVSILDVPFIEYLYVGSFIATTEAVSNFEKFSILGFKISKELISKLNSDFKDLDKMKDHWIDKK